MIMLIMEMVVVMKPALRAPPPPPQRAPPQTFITTTISIINIIIPLLLIPSPPLLLPSPSPDHREVILEADMPLQKRVRFTTLPYGFEIEESLTAAAARQTGHALTSGVDYGFIDTVDAHSASRSQAMEAHIRALHRDVSVVQRINDRDRLTRHIQHEHNRARDAAKIAPKKTPINDAAIKQLIAQGVADALAEHEANKNSISGDDSYESGSGKRRIVPTTREYTYSDFLKFQPLNFKGIAGVVGLKDFLVMLKLLLLVMVTTAGLQYVEERLVHYKKNESVFTKKINVLNLKVKLRDKVLAEYTTNLEKSEKQRDVLKLTLEKLQNSSKYLNTLLDSQVSDKSKAGLGYKELIPESFVNSSELLEKQDNRSDKGYHEVPPPLTGNYMPPKRDLKLIDEHFKSESVDVSTVSSSDVKTVKTIDHKGVFSTEEPKPVRKNSFGPPIIEDWHSDDDSEDELSPTAEVKTVKPIVEKIKSVKTTGETVKTEESPKQHKHHPRGNQRN
nr:hypothetical protein [Tanacetum cinerariifolium]